MLRALARLSLLTLLGLSSLACGDDPLGRTGEGTTPPVVEGPPRALLDPAQGLVPLPMDWLLDDERRDGVAGAGFSDAQREHFQLWHKSEGWPITADVVVPLSAPAKDSSLASAVVLYDVVSKETLPLEVSLSDDKRTLHAQLAEGTLAPGRSYLALVLGGAGGLRHEDGGRMARDPLMHQLLSEDVVGDAALEAVRETFADARALLEELSVARADVIAALPFTTTSRPAVWSSARLLKEPFPGNHLVEPDGRVRVLPFPEPIAGIPEMEELRERLSRQAGFSTTGALLLETTSAMDRDTALSPGAIRLFHLSEDDVISEVTELERGLYADGRTVWLRPKLALEHSSRYAWIVTSDLQAGSGGSFTPQGPSSFTQLRAPLLDDGRSLVLGLDDVEAAALEDTRQTIAQVSAHLSADDDDVFAAALAFDTLRVPETIFSYTDQLATREVPVTLSDVVEETPFSRGLWIAMPRVKTVLSGKLTTLDFLDPYTRRLREGEPVLRDIEFVLTIPDGAEPGEPLPVVLFGHGLITSRELAYGIADKLASEGFAVFSIDLPFHGERSVCSQDLECSFGSSCALDGSCVKGDGSRAELRKVASAFAHGPSVPVTTGVSFIDPVDVFASRDHFLQGLVDLKQAVRVLQHADVAAVSGGYVLDDEAIGYAGISLGGIFGAALSAIEPDIESFALNVPGADFVTMMEDSATLGVLLEHAVSEYGIEAQTPAWIVFESAARWALDLVDPLNLTHHAAFAPLSYLDPQTGEERVMPEKRLLIQMAEGDLVVPNSGTEQLSARTGVAIESFSPLVSGHGFLFDPTSLEGARARDQVAAFLLGE